MSAKAREQLPFGSFGTSREREFFRYLPSYHLQTRSLPHIDRESQQTPSLIRPSLDSSLTSFAQLGTLRLNAKRTLISLFGRSAQFVLAEATRDVSLHDDGSDKAHQGLWIGCCTMSYERSLCKTIMAHSQTTGDIPAPLVVSDLSQVEDFKDHPDVQNKPHLRFMACSPIVSPKGIVIGAYTVLDDKPHGPLDADMRTFLIDIANTVMDHLDATRSRREYLRGERMMVGLGSFLQGKGSLRTSWIHEHESILTPLTPGEDLETEGHVNQEQQNKQISEQAPLTKVTFNENNTVQFSSQNFNTVRSHKSSASMSASTPETQKQSLATSNIDSRDYFQPRSRYRRASHTTTGPRLQDFQKMSSKDIYNVNVKETFSRAANIVRESIEVEAVVFFDAEFRSPEALVKNSRSDSDSGSSLEPASSSEEEAKLRVNQTQSRISSEAQPELCGRSSVHPCDMLGFATSHVASVNEESLADHRVSISENFLGQLLRRYPRGQIFSFGEDGTVSSDDTRDGMPHRSGVKKFKKTRKGLLRQDAVTLLQLAPHARSIIFSPLWDSHKERWHSACFAWTKAPHRVLTSNDELAFLFACGHSIMAEIHRLAALLTERAKSDLLAGISHELRSPLHGIFGTVDILNDTVMNVLQQGFLHTISSCAFTLLGSIDQLLEYASINDVRNNSVKAAEPREISVIKAEPNPQPEKSEKDSVVQLDAAVEDAIETVFAGYSFLKTKNTLLRNSISPLGNPFDFEAGVKVILDIDRSENLKFATRPGAWHVILTNFFGNALKFTDDGFIYVSLKANPVKFDSRGRALQSKVALCIKDTGCGMEEDFLKKELFTAFSKEDKMSIGNGLGIHIVNRIVSSLGGEIQISSQKGVGTEVVTTVTLDHVVEETSPPEIPNGIELLSSPKELTRGKTIGILLHTSSDGDAALLSSIHRLCENWFQMKVELVEPSDLHLGQCDFYISLHESLAIGNRGIMPIRHRFGDRPKPPVIVICSSPKIAHTLASHNRKDAGVFEFISQPCGPYKLAKSLEICVQRERLGNGLLRSNQPSSSPSPIPNPIVVDPMLQKKMILPDRTNQSPAPVKTPFQVTAAAHLTPPAFLVTPGWEQNVPAGDYLTVQPHSSLPSNTILLVDDNEINLKILVAYMTKSGYSYAAAKNGQEALDIFKQNANNIEIILMDVSMPVMDGIEATRRIREFEKTLSNKTRTMIIALTGVAQAETERAAIGSGMDTFLTKPARLDSLLPLIKQRLPST
ncbi:uncharacterized protein N7483_006425 [Penicillium malachiteum]|uniref:uncharacterized protein n=1 Tax=Penicillium malachiteum TaxID=1324776 RepID=UPI0025494254|nr:uncharacterized protein N7483_006425 [Penicillium malachiteum]KAJ5725068.1 hypothetical protein N7483_006425 [Penicillium malachiteum]